MRPRTWLLGGKNLDEFPLEKFSGRGVRIKIQGNFEIEEIKKQDIHEGDIVLFHTGMSEKYHDAAYYEEYPAIPEAVANYLVEKRVKMVGVDMCSVDYAPYPVHRILLGKDVLIIENLTNLALLAGKNFEVHAFPIKLQIDGAPVRVVADAE